MTITKTTKNGREMWRLNVPASFGGRRQRRFFETKAAAEVWLMGARKNLLERGTTESHSSITVAEALDAYLAAKASTGDRHKKAMLRYASLIRESFGKRALDSVSVLEFNDWINRPEWAAAASRATARRYCLCFWNWCVKNELLDRNRAKGSEVQGGTKKSIHILTVKQCKELLEATEGRMRAVVVLQLFAGLRTCEALAATKSWVNLSAKEIVVYDSKETTGIPRRTVRIRPAFLRWWPKGITGKVWQANERNLRAQRARLFKALGWRPPQNALRHSFASYLLAAELSAAAVALEMGHGSEQMVRKVYGHAVKSREAEKFWDL